MPTPSLWFDPEDPQLRSKVDGLQPAPGYCVFIDIVGSTAMKQKGTRHWFALIHNCIANARLFLAPFSPIKIIGDALMYYVEASDLARSGNPPILLFDGLWQIANDRDSRFPSVRIGAARCEDVYPITFVRGNQDYYGADIDMTARLQRLASEAQVVIERRLYDDVSADYQRFGNRDQFVSFRSLSGPARETLKGIPAPVEVFRTSVV